MLLIKLVLVAWTPAHFFTSQNSVSFMSLFFIYWSSKKEIFFLESCQVPQKSIAKINELF